MNKYAFFSRQSTVLENLESKQPASHHLLIKRKMQSVNTGSPGGHVPFRTAHSHLNSFCLRLDSGRPGTVCAKAPKAQSPSRPNSAQPAEGFGADLPLECRGRPAGPG